MCIQQVQLICNPSGEATKFLTSIVLMGMATLQEGVTNVRIEVGRNRLVTATLFTSRRDAEERYNRHAGAANMITI